MSLSLPRKRTLLAWHRWLGFAATVFLVILSLTGLALNHTERLKLDQIVLRSEWILNQYGMAGGSQIRSYRISETDTISYLDGQLFFNQAPLLASEAPVGLALEPQFTLVVCPNALIYLTPDGELIEKLPRNQLPMADSIQQIGQSPEKRPILATASGVWSTDENWLNFESYDGSYTVTPLPLAQLNPIQEARLLEAFQGEGITLYRVLLDLHSGRLFGWGGRTVMDLTAIAILLLIASGLAGYFRRTRRKTNP